MVAVERVQTLPLRKSKKRRVANIGRASNASPFAQDFHLIGPRRTSSHTPSVSLDQALETSPIMQTAYHYILCVLFYSSIPLFQVLAAVINPTDSLGPSENVSPSPAVGTVDPRFSIDESFNGPKIPPIACLMSTVQALLKLGLQDFAGTMEAKTWEFKTNPPVEISISPVYRQRLIDRRFVVWGLREGVTSMISANKFKTASFILSWEGKTVGFVRIEAQSSAAIIYANETQGLTQESNLLSHNSRASIGDDLADKTPTEITVDEHLKVFATSRGSTLSAWSVFRLVIVALAEAAEWKATERVEDYTEDVPGVEINFFQLAAKSSSPPLFEGQWLIKALSVIPGYMLKRGVFKEVLLFMEVDGVRVAEGFMESTTALVGSQQAYLNVSIS